MSCRAAFAPFRGTARAAARCQRTVLFTGLALPLSMSALGVKTEVSRFQVISALPHKADINCRHCEVRFVPRTHSRVVMRRCLGIDHGPPVTYQYALLNIPQTSISAE